MIAECLMALIVVAAWAGHTDESREAAEDFRAAADDLKLLDKQVAAAMRLANEQELSRQLAGHPMNYWRVKSMPAAFRLALLKREAARLGAVVLTPSEREFLIGAARLGRRRMAKAFPNLFSERRVS